MHKIQIIFPSGITKNCVAQNLEEALIILPVMFEAEKEDREKGVCRNCGDFGGWHDRTCRTGMRLMCEQLEEEGICKSPRCGVATKCSDWHDRKKEYLEGGKKDEQTGEG
jgi:hypothetical protein